MKKFCESLRQNALEIINLKKKKKKLLANGLQKRYENAKVCYICKEQFEDKHAKVKKYCKVIDHCHYTGECRGATHSISNLKYSVPKEISAVFHNKSNYEYHFIIKEQAEEFEGQFICLGEYTKTYQFQQKKEVTRIDKKEKKIQKPYLSDCYLLIAQDL